MSYHETLPEGCPPPESDEVVSPVVVFRLVRSSPPSLDDFRSQRAERPSAAFAVSECIARGLSVYASVADCDKTRKLPRFQGALVCKVHLEAGAGRIQRTGRATTHHTWWPLAAFEILSHCEVVVA